MRLHPTPASPWMTWSPGLWEVATLADLRASGCANWLRQRDEAGRNILMACLHHPACQHLVQALFDEVMMQDDAHTLLAQEDARGVGLLAHLFRHATKRRFDYRDWVRVGCTAPPVNSRGQGVLWQLARLAGCEGSRPSAITPAPWFGGELCIDPRWVVLSAHDWQAGMSEAVVRDWIAGCVLVPGHHNQKTIASPASGDLHALSRYLLPLRQSASAAAQKQAWLPVLADTLDVLAVALEELGRNPGVAVEESGSGWQPAHGALVRLCGAMDLGQSVFTTLLGRHAWQGGRWTLALDHAISAQQAGLLENATCASGESAGGRRL